MLEWFSRRYLDVVGSIYIYNEHRGYTAIDRVIEAVRDRSPDDFKLIARIERHRADERKHYLMFRRWFERRGVMPLRVDRSFGHICQSAFNRDPLSACKRDPLAVAGIG